MSGTTPKGTPRGRSPRTPQPANGAASPGWPRQGGQPAPKGGHVQSVKMASRPSSSSKNGVGPSPRAAQLTPQSGRAGHHPVRVLARDSNMGAAGSLSFKKGDVLTLTGSMPDANGNWQGELNGQAGAVPEVCIRLRARATFTFHAESADEISFHRHDVLTILSTATGERRGAPTSPPRPGTRHTRTERRWPPRAT